MENANESNIPSSSQGKRRIWPLMILVILLASFSGSIFGFLAGSGALIIRSGAGKSIFQRIGIGSVPSSSSLQVEKIVQDDTVITSMVERVSPAVVSIIISKNVPQYRSLDPFGFFTQPVPGKGQAQQIGGGSGFLVTTNGMIVTNKHVVDDPAAEYTVVMNDGKEYSAQVLARDPVQDVAIIKIEGDNFPILPLGDSDQMKIGQTVLAIGNSLGEFSNTVSKGIISGLRRNLTAGSVLGETEQLRNIIQTDAPINPGNSGGPLLNVNGEVIGVNVAIAQGAQNVGFALPINQIKRIISQVKDTGKISTAFLGVRYVIINKDIQAQNNLSFDYGAIVLRGNKVSDLAVAPGSPADKAGIVENDIILEINGTKIDSENPLGDLIANFAPGEEITLKVWHKGETKDIKVRLEERK